ncbi:hypothetical protein MSAN_02394700 [Mycena sanguinolenta]|uniref:Uncharacterized protein n=1 Tax=Mycena sanguinolenta TaxID=230812 RepID=A0A8H7CFU8_9AGAR|nr:hypothetical protein MSAN_02394700 [Mycena sanguinolenta]
MRSFSSLTLLSRPDLIDLCTAALSEKFFSLDEMIATLRGRSLFSAALCICCAQTFIDRSSVAMGFGPAFVAALNAYLGSNTEPAVVAEIYKITDSLPSTDPPPPASPPFSEYGNASTRFLQLPWLKKQEEKKRKEREEREGREKREMEKREREEREKREKEREEREQEALIDIIKTYRLRFHEEKKARMQKANPL